MNQVSVYFKRILKINELIREENTGKASHLAKKFNITERSIYNYLKFMKEELDAPIVWDEAKQTYCYSRKGEIRIEWTKK